MPASDMLVAIRNDRDLVQRAKFELVQHAGRKLGNRDYARRSLRRNRQDGAIVKAKRRTIAFWNEISIGVVHADDLAGGHDGSYIAEAQQDASRQKGQNALGPYWSAYPAGSWLHMNRVQIETICAPRRDDEICTQGSRPLLL